MTRPGSKLRHHERAGAGHVRLGVVGLPAVGNDERLRRQDVAERRVVDLQRELDLVVVDLRDPARVEHGGERGARRRRGLLVEDLVERVDDVVGGERLAVVERDALAQLDHPVACRAVHRLPRLRQARDGVAVGRAVLRELVEELPEAGQADHAVPLPRIGERRRRRLGEHADAQQPAGGRRRRGQCRGPTRAGAGERSGSPGGAAAEQRAHAGGAEHRRAGSRLEQATAGDPRLVLMQMFVRPRHDTPPNRSSVRMYGGTDRFAVAAPPCQGLLRWGDLVQRSRTGGS